MQTLGRPAISAGNLVEHRPSARGRDTEQRLCVGPMVYDGRAVGRGMSRGQAGGKCSRRGAVGWRGVFQLTGGEGGLSKWV